MEIIIIAIGFAIVFFLHDLPMMGLIGIAIMAVGLVTPSQIFNKRKKEKEENDNN